MHIAYHIGAHCTGSDLIVDTLRRNARLLGPQGIIVPDRAAYQKRMGDVIKATEQQDLTPAQQANLLHDFTKRGNARRLVLSNSGFLCVSGWAFSADGLYPQTEKLGRMRGAFADHDVSFHLCIRDPATFLPALFRNQSRHKSLEALLDGVDPRTVRWSDFIRRIRETCPDSPITVWCYEDAPFIWLNVVRSMAGLPNETSVVGALDFANTEMSFEGRTKMKGYMRMRRPKSPQMASELIDVFLRNFPRESFPFEVLPPWWDQALSESLTLGYHEDVALIEEMENVTVLER
ncbi:hypothetical protein [Palleronia caenipelagi]|uniref:Sulfotransferase n=1 Tax=Palleronia caenipelagi TaxID=2489174 RepID=A0A547PT97_9RHOB|nr:hypothetical protein [Palleronia caenipelagi]TRD17373.1 hypothetical protein FEV53_13120 [Palleronia caenipelagi]